MWQRIVSAFIVLLIYSQMDVLFCQNLAPVPPAPPAPPAPPVVAPQPCAIEVRIVDPIHGMLGQPKALDKEAIAKIAAIWKPADIGGKKYVAKYNSDLKMFTPTEISGAYILIDRRDEFGPADTANGLEWRGRASLCGVMYRNVKIEKMRMIWDLWYDTEGKYISTSSGPMFTDLKRENGKWMIDENPKNYKTPVKTDLPK